MTKEAYFEIYNTEPDVINLSKEDIVEWLDTIAENAKKLHESIYGLNYGNLNVKEGEYEYNIQHCDNTDMFRLHIYEGIELLADAVGAKLSLEDDHSNTYRYKYFFDYKWMTVFQLENELLERSRNDTDRR